MKELKARRKELKIKQQDLADQLGISRPQLSRYENGLREADERIIEKWKGILFGLKFSDLEVGDYVYVRDDLQHGHSYGNRFYLEKMGGGLLKITSIRKDNTIELSENKSMGYSPEMIDLSRSMKKEDYLKMNENEDVSFNDLIDAAVQAKKEGIINHLIIGNSMIDFNYDYDDKNNHFDEEEVKEGIEFIQSLYTEEFVIEKMADELKIKSGAQLILSNGMKCIYFDDGDRKLRHDGDYYPCNFLILKGATVKQSK